VWHGCFFGLMASGRGIFSPRLDSVGFVPSCHSVLDLSGKFQNLEYLGLIYFAAPSDCCNLWFHLHLLLPIICLQEIQVAYKKGSCVCHLS
jgi:hypothetical protein